MADTLLQVRHLKKYFKTGHGMLHAVDDISFDLERGKTLGLVEVSPNHFVACFNHGV